MEKAIDLSYLYQKVFRAEKVSLPGSKSLTNRALLLASLPSQPQRTILTGALLCEDSLAMITVLKQLGVSIQVSSEQIVVTPPRDGRFQTSLAPLYVDKAGTLARFLPCVLAFHGTGTYKLQAHPQMVKRPMKKLIDQLMALGAVIQEDPSQDGWLVITAQACPKASLLDLDRLSQEGESSQFVSGLLMLGALFPGVLTYFWSQTKGQGRSWTYIRMTERLLSIFGVEGRSDLNGFYTQTGALRAVPHYAVEQDGSSGSYFFAAAAISGGYISLKEKPMFDLYQSDWGFLDILIRMGCFYDEKTATLIGPKELKPVQVHMETMSDVAPTLGVLALKAKGLTQITGIGHMRYKESDRVSVLIRGIKQAGGQVQEGPDDLIIGPGPVQHSLSCLSFDPQEDHRMAMAFSLLGFIYPQVYIQNPACVKKTWPSYFDDLNRVFAK